MRAPCLGKADSVHSKCIKLLVLLFRRDVSSAHCSPKRCYRTTSRPVLFSVYAARESKTPTAPLDPIATVDKGKLPETTAKKSERKGKRRGRINCVQEDVCLREQSKINEVEEKLGDPELSLHGHGEASRMRRIINRKLQATERRIPSLDTISNHPTSSENAVGHASTVAIITHG